MRRIATILIISVLGVVIAARLFLVVTETYKAESKIDISEAPSFVECANPVEVIIDKNDITYINDNVIEESKIENYLREISVATSDACINIHISELASSGLLIKISSIATKNDLRSQLVIIPE